MAGTMNPGVEILISGVWTDISADVQYTDNIDISRGRADEGAQSDPASMTLTLDNRTGNYSPRNPRGTYYGKIGRNTKIRAFVKAGQVRQRNAGNDYFSCASSVGLQITGDIDLRSDIWLSTWRPNSPAWIGVIKNNSYGLFVQSDGRLVIGWWSGTVFASVDSGVPIPGGTVGRKSVRASLQVNNGAGGHTATFYYSSDQTMAGTWIQFAQVTVAGTVTIDSNANIVQTYVTVDACPAELNEMRVYSGLAVTLRADPVFTSQANGATSFADAQGNTWSNGTGAAQLDNRHYRFWGDVTSWPIKWDVSGTWRYAEITAAGMLRRLGQGNAPLKSALRRAVPAIGAAVVGYWPLEDDKGATTPEAVIGGTIRPRYMGAVDVGAYTQFVATSAAPTLNGGRIWLPVKTYTNTNYFQVRFLFRLNSTTIPTNTVVCRIWTNSSLGWIDWIYQTGDTMFFKAYDNLGVLSLTSTPFDLTNEINGQDCLVSLEFKKNGVSVDLKQVILPIGETVGFLAVDTTPAITLGSCTVVYFNPGGVAMGDVSIGQVRVENVETSVFDLSLQTNGFRGEAASARIHRLCTENNIVPKIAGDGEPSEVMGYQTRIGLVSLFQEAALVDGGIMHEARMSEALRYRSRESMGTQDPAFTVSYAAEGLAGFEPTDDDQRTRNKVTVTRDGGTTVTVEDSTSSMGTASPPTGVGIYDEALSALSLYSDDLAQHQAGWRVNLGTMDEARFPTISLNLAHPDYTANAALTRQILLTNVGDRIVITNPPTWLPPEQIDQLVQGSLERINQFEHTITFNCAPARPHRVAQQNAPAGWTARYTNATTTLGGTMTTGATSVSVVHSSGRDWTIADGSFDIMVSGERMTVTNVVGSGAQTFTVTRSVNGIVKTHASGEAVALFDPVVYGITGKAGSSGRYLRALDINLPDPVFDVGNGINSITALAFADLPSVPVSASILNPHPDRSMVLLVGYGGWGFTSGSGFRVSTIVTRANSTFTPTGPDSNGPIGWGEIIFVANTLTAQYQVCYTTILPPAVFPYVFKTQAYRDSAVGVQTWEYATMRLTPIQYV